MPPQPALRIYRSGSSVNPPVRPGDPERKAAASRDLSNRAVANELFLSDQTVKFHLHRIYGKLGVANRTEATRIAHQLGVVGQLAQSG